MAFTLSRAPRRKSGRRHPPPRRRNLRRRNGARVRIAEMGADISDDVGDLRVAHHVADRRHALQAPEQHGQHEVGRSEVLVVRKRRIGSGADRAFRVRLVAGCADMTVQVRPALFGKRPTRGSWRRGPTPHRPAPGEAQASAPRATIAKPARAPLMTRRPACAGARSHPAPRGSRPPARPECRRRARPPARSARRSDRGRRNAPCALHPTSRRRSPA